MSMLSNFSCLGITHCSPSYGHLELLAQSIGLAIARDMSDRKQFRTDAKMQIKDRLGIALCPRTHGLCPNI